MTFDLKTKMLPLKKEEKEKFHNNDGYFLVIFLFRIIFL